MMRFVLLPLPLLFAAACAPTDEAGNTVDINAAAIEAQGTVDAYSNASGADAVEIAEPEAGGAPDDGATADDAGGNDTRDAEAPLDPPAPGTPGGLPDDRTPMSEAPFTPDSAQGAANVVQTYYALIGAGKYREAFGLRALGASGPTTVAAFVADFGRYSEYHANVGAPGAIEAGAGQRYVTVPIQIYARLKRDRTPVYQIGSVTLHRTGEIDGATSDQRTWHIRRIDLKAAPKR